MSATQPVLDYKEVIIDTSLLTRLLSANNDALVTRSRPIRIPVFASFQLSCVMKLYIFPMAVSVQLKTVGTRIIAPSSGMTSGTESSTAGQELTTGRQADPLKEKVIILIVIPTLSVSHGT